VHRKKGVQPRIETTRLDAMVRNGGPR
jgi:hypothetical protein